MARLRTRVIPEEFWERKMTELTREERSILDALASLERPTNKRQLTAQRILELANKPILCTLRGIPRIRLSWFEWCF